LIDLGEEKSAKFLKYGCGCYLFSLAVFLITISFITLLGLIVK
jgi:hypothetical protein